MTGLSKFKYIIVILAALAVVASVTAFSVSYAKWTTGETELNASVGIGAWEEQVVDPSGDTSQYDNGALCTDKNGNKADADLTAMPGFTEYGQSNIRIYVEDEDRLPVTIKLKVKLSDETYGDYEATITESGLWVLTFTKFPAAEGSSAFFGYQDIYQIPVSSGYVPDDEVYILFGD